MKRLDLRRAVVTSTVLTAVATISGYSVDHNLGSAAFGAGMEWILLLLYEMRRRR
ncbi:MAG TPA: hypothetical protein VG650_15700 [Mycobacteriales bacterium]|nr:hypothetical protein [Mycobacteriales bacterium]